MAKFFFGGVHPDDGKSLASHRAIEPLPPPPRVVIPLSQHIGAVCRPLVKKGDAVCLGQKIGDGAGPVPRCMRPFRAWWPRWSPA